MSNKFGLVVAINYFKTTNELYGCINDGINIINANKVDNNFLLDVNITSFDKNFDILEIIQSKKIDITLKKWVIFNPTISPYIIFFWHL